MRELDWFSEVLSITKNALQLTERLDKNEMGCQYEKYRGFVKSEQKNSGLDVWI